VVAALNSGYKLLDTASAYENEDIIGAILQYEGRDRDEVRQPTRNPSDDA
jgi:diketogulonate reductase-like aldo/keto reductase